MFTLPALVPIGNPHYDYPQYCFGEDENGNYGLYFVVDSYGTDVTPIIGFISIAGLGQFGMLQVSQPLVGLANINTIANIAASADGRVWTQGSYGVSEFNLFGQPPGLLFKSPGGHLI